MALQQSCTVPVCEALLACCVVLGGYRQMRQEVTGKGAEGLEMGFQLVKYKAWFGWKKDVQAGKLSF